MEGLDGAAFSAENGIRSGREKGYKANAQELLYNGRINYSGISGFQIGTSFSYNDAYVAIDSTIATTLFEFHAKYNANNIIAVFEYGNISYDGNDVGFNVEAAMGYYFDFGYDVAPLLEVDGKLIPWFRYSDYNTASSVGGGGNPEKANHYTKWMLGLSLQPIDQVVFKADYGVKKNDLTEVEETLFNLGAGYLF